MNESTWRQPSLWRVVVFSLVVGLLGNTMLYRLTVVDDTFANIIAIASGITGALLIVAWFLVPRLVDDLLLVTFAIWTANVIEFATEDAARWESQVRQCSLYASAALLALGAYVGRRTHGR